MMIKCHIPHEKIRRVLFDWTEERTAFLVGQRVSGTFVIIDIWPTPNVTRRDPRHAYAISTQAWREARERARKLGLEIVGHAHSHPNGGVEPSALDIRYIRPNEIGLVYQPRGWLTWYTKKGAVKTEPMKQPIWAKLIGLLF